MEYIIIIIALVVGLVAGWLAGRSAGLSAGRREVDVKDALLSEHQRSSEQRLAEQQRVSEERYGELQRVSDERLAEQQRVSEVRLAEQQRVSDERYCELQRVSEERLAERDRFHRQAVDAMQAKFDESIAKMQEQLKNLTGEMLRDRQQEFARSSKENIDHIVEPLKTTIREMKAAVDSNNEKHDKLSGEMSANILNLLKHSDSARASADRLADALTHNTRVQGAWGETVLTELLESQNLREGIHFDTQQTMTDSAGKTLVSDNESRMRPDVILHLDRTRDVIIDSKVSLSAYMDYVNATTEEARNAALKAHVESVRKHVKELSEKDYTAYIKPPKQRMDYVIMFMPCTPALYAATSYDDSLWRKAMEKNVYIADEQTLYAALKIINMTWVQIAQTENHEKVYALADEMLKRVGMFMEKYVAIGKRIDEARAAYDAGMDKLREGGQSIPGTCRKLVSLGAKAQTRKGVDPSLLGVDELA